MLPSTFPYFILVALEAGGLFRGLLLLLLYSLYPVLLLLGHGRATKLMVMVSFADVRKEDGSSSFRVGSAVMPKLFLEDVSAKVLDRGGGAAGIERRDGRYDIWAQGYFRTFTPFLSTLQPKIIILISTMSIAKLPCL